MLMLPVATTIPAIATLAALTAIGLLGWDGNYGGAPASDR
jgi:hypothetical protein